jgi:hypothetical protein
MPWWFIVRNKTNNCIYRYVNLFYCKQRSLLHISATYYGHLQGGVLWRMYYIERQNNCLGNAAQCFLNLNLGLLLRSRSYCSHFKIRVWDERLSFCCSYKLSHSGRHCADESTTALAARAYRTPRRRVSQLKICDFSGEAFKGIEVL